MNLPIIIRTPKNINSDTDESTKINCALCPIRNRAIKDSIKPTDIANINCIAKNIGIAH